MTPPEIARYQCRANHAEIVLQLTEDLFWFAGHFPDQAILPGVAQLNWVMYYSQQLLAADYTFHSIRQLKFMVPLLPGDRVTLVLDWQPSSHLLAFRYQRQMPDQQWLRADNNQHVVVSDAYDMVSYVAASDGNTADEAIARGVTASQHITSRGKLCLCR